MNSSPRDFLLLLKLLIISCDGRGCSRLCRCRRHGRSGRGGERKRRGLRGRAIERIDEVFCGER